LLIVPARNHPAIDPPSIRQRLAALWGLFGVLALLCFAIWRLAPIAWEALEDCERLAWFHWVVLIVFTGFMIRAEGYKGFQKSFSPRTAARARWLLQDDSLVRAILAPVFCMGYHWAGKRTRIVATCLTIGIVILVILIRVFLDQPWRGIVDAGVVVGLSYGVVTLLVFGYRALSSRDFSHDPDVSVPPR